MNLDKKTTKSNYFSAQGFCNALQEDHYNCGVFVIQFIKHYLSCRVENDKINFDCSPTSLECDRLLISPVIEHYKKN